MEERCVCRDFKDGFVNKEGGEKRKRKLPQIEERIALRDCKSWFN